MYENLTLERIRSILNNIKFKPDIEHNQIMIGQYCKTKGFIFRSGLDLNICDDPECGSCNEFDNAIKKAANSFIEDTTPKLDYDPQI